MTGSVGVFLWATGSQMDMRVRRPDLTGGFFQAYNLSELPSVATS